MADTRVDVRSSRLGTQPENIQGHYPYISTRSVIAGLFVTLLCFAILMTLGVAVGGLALNEIIGEGGGRGLSIGAGVWFIVSTLLSLFAGSYFAARIANFITPRIGAAQGLTISSIFFVLFLWQLGSALGWAGSTVGSAVGSAGRAAATMGPKIANSPQVAGLVDKAIGDLNLRSDPKVVAQGVVSRLVSGDQEGAKNYLATQAGISPAEADRRLNSIQGQVASSAESAGKTAANVVSGIGWTLFGMMVLGTLAATLGGGVASRANARHSISLDDRVAYGSPTTAGV